LRDGGELDRVINLVHTMRQLGQDLLRGGALKVEIQPVISEGHDALSLLVQRHARTVVGQGYVVVDATQVEAAGSLNIYGQLIFSRLDNRALPFNAKFINGQTNNRFRLKCKLMNLKYYFKRINETVEYF